MPQFMIVYKGEATDMSDMSEEEAGAVHEVETAAVVMVTSRTPVDALYYSLADRIDITRIGDCLAPGTIATSVYSGHQYAREMDADPPAEVRFRRERAVAP